MRIACCVSILACAGVVVDDGARSPRATPRSCRRRRRRGPSSTPCTACRFTDPLSLARERRDAEVEAWTKHQHEATAGLARPRTRRRVAGLHDELVAYFDRDITQPPFFKKGREFFFRTRKGEAQAKVYTQTRRRARCCIFDPIALDPTGKTSVGAFVLNRDASRAAVATYSKGSEITDFRVIDTRTGEQIGAVMPGIESFSWARDERYAFVSPRTKESIDRAGAAALLSAPARRRSARTTNC